MTQNWFDVDKEGLKELQAGKPKHYVLRELIQNALDEDIKTCDVKIILQNNGMVMITVEDDNKQGFKDLRDGYTLFKHTDKRKNPEQRGRFNLGEKQCFSICDYAKIETTKGTIIFDKDGRKEFETGLSKGSKITIQLKATEKEVGEMIEIVDKYIIPKNVKFTLNGIRLQSKIPFKSFEASLTTEIEQDKVLRKTTRKTKVDVYKSTPTYLYEMGIPVQEIDCQYSIDVQQKIPMGVDRETVSASFLQDLYAEVLNNVHEDVVEENSSQLWVRQAMADERIQKDAVKDITEKRFGDKVCIANNFDPNSIDEAVANGYNVIYGSELSSDEWSRLKENDLMQSSSDLFGTNFTNAPVVEPNDKQKQTANFAKKIAKRLLGINISVVFVKGGFNMVTAQYGSNQLTFNIDKLNGFFNEPVSAKTIDLILHELGHHAGNHTEHSYHELITKMAGELTMIALKEPKFFEVA